MKRSGEIHSSGTARLRCRLSAAVAGFALLALTAPAAMAQDADKLLKTMADYVTGQSNISFKYDSEVEVITSGMQKIQFNSSGEATLSRPDKMRLSRKGGYTDVDLVFDGKTISLLAKDANAYFQTESSGTIDDAVERIRDKLNVGMPGADFLLSRLYQELTAEGTDGIHVGQGVIEGVDCEHLAFRNSEVDWQIWIEAGSNPIPRKYVITSKHVTGAPQYTLRIRDWKTGVTTDPAVFTFKAPEGAKKVEPAMLVNFDEVPAGQVSSELKGGKQ